MDKPRLHAALLDQLRAELDLLTRAALDARDEAVSEESKPENQYDMHAQEAAYLAEGQARQAAEVVDAIQAFQSLSLVRPADGRIAVGCLVTLSGAPGARPQHYFVAPARGGISAEIDDVEVTVVTPTSPLGAQLVGRGEGDLVQLPSRRGGPQTLRIQSVL